MKKKYTWLIIVIVVVGGGYYWYHETHAKTAQVQYVTAPATVGTIVTSVSGTGNVIVGDEASVDPTITGTVANLSVNVGDTVKAGQTLFTIVNDQLGTTAEQAQVSYENAKSSLDSAKANEKQAQYNLDHPNTSGLATKNILKEKLSSAKVSETAAEQNVSVAESSYQNALSDADKRTVTSPISGTVMAVNINNGDDLGKTSSNGSSGSNSTPIIIGDPSTMEAQVQVNEVDIPNVQIGQKAMMTFDAINGLTVTGKVEKMDSMGTVSQGVVTYNVTISFDSIDPRIKPGMSVSANIITAVKQDVLTVPASAVQAQNGGNYVEVLKNGTPQQVPVQVGISNDTDTEITSGLQAGDQIVTQTINPNAKATTTTTSGGGGFGGGGRMGGGAAGAGAAFRAFGG